MVRYTLPVVAVGLTASAALASPVDARFAGGGVSVNTFANGANADPDSDTTVEPAEGAVIDADGSTTSGLVSSVGMFDGRIDVLSPASPFDGAFTSISLSAQVDLFQSEPGGSAFGGISATFFDGPFDEEGSSPIIIEIDQPSFFDVSLDTFGDFDEFSLEFVPLEGAEIDGNVLSPGLYQIDFTISGELGPNELQNSFGFDWELRLSVVPLPGPAAMALLGVTAVATRRRRA